MKFLKQFFQIPLLFSCENVCSGLITLYFYPRPTRFMRNARPHNHPHDTSIKLLPKEKNVEQATAGYSRLPEACNLLLSFSILLFLSHRLLGKIKIEGTKWSPFRVGRLGVNQEDRRQMRGCKTRRARPGRPRPAPSCIGEGKKELV